MFDPDLEKTAKLRAEKPTKTQNAMDRYTAEKLSHTKAPPLHTPPRPTEALRIADTEEVFKFYFRSSMAIRKLYGYQLVEGHLELIEPEKLAGFSEVRKASLRQAVTEWEEEQKKR